MGYGLFELAFVLAVVLAATLPFWAGIAAERMRRYLTSRKPEDKN
jgi:hypothetical protein